MQDRPPALANGYVWMMNALVPSAKAQLLEHRLGDILHELRIRDYSEMGDPDYDTGIELWVHPDDERRSSLILQQLWSGE